MKALIIIPLNGKYILLDAKVHDQFTLHDIRNVVSADYFTPLSDTLRDWHLAEPKQPVNPPPEST